MHDTRLPNSLEQLESRIAPAAGVGGSVDFGPPTIVDAHTLTFKELDGDNVTVKFSKGILDSDDAIEKYFTFETYGGDLAATAEGGWFYGAKLISIDLNQLNAKKFRGLSISVTAEPGESSEESPRIKETRGDGHVNVGAIHADGLDLGNVLVDGSLEQITAGDSNANNGGLKSLTLDYLAGYNYSGEGGYYSPVSTIVGAIKSLNIHNDIDAAVLKVIGGKKAGIGEAIIGGSLLGSYDDFGGSIYVSGSIGKISVGGNLDGSYGKYSGSILADGNIGSVHIAGAILGGDSYSGYSGIVQADGKIGSATVVGDIHGGNGERSGMIHGGLAIGKVEVQGNIFGGEGYAAGRIETAGKISEVVVGGNIVGGTADYSGSIMSTETIKSVTLNGNLEGTNYRGTGSVFSEDGIDRLSIDGNLIGGGGHGSGSVQAASVIKALSLTGDLTGGDGDGSGSVLSLAGNIKKVLFEGVKTPGAGELSGVIGGQAGIAAMAEGLFGSTYEFGEATGNLTPVSHEVTTYVPSSGEIILDSDLGYFSYGAVLFVGGFSGVSGGSWVNGNYQFVESTGVLTAASSGIGGIPVLNSSGTFGVSQFASELVLGDSAPLNFVTEVYSSAAVFNNSLGGGGTWDFTAYYAETMVLQVDTPEASHTTVTEGLSTTLIFNSETGELVA